MNKRKITRKTSEKHPKERHGIPKNVTVRRLLIEISGGLVGKENHRVVDQIDYLPQSWPVSILDVLVFATCPLEHL